jgi:hypothetical protein
MLSDITTVSTSCVSTTRDFLCIKCDDLATRVQQGVTDFLRDWQKQRNCSNRDTAISTVSRRISTVDGSVLSSTATSAILLLIERKAEMMPAFSNPQNMRRTTSSLRSIVFRTAAACTICNGYTTVWQPLADASASDRRSDELQAPDA